MGNCADVGGLFECSRWKARGDDSYPLKHTGWRAFFSLFLFVPFTAGAGKLRPVKLSNLAC